MTKLKLYNVHKLAIANEGEQRKPIHIPFGTWAYDDTIDQTLDREHAEAIAADLAGKIAAGEPGIPVYQGHPDVPEYAGKYPDKGALGWVKKILVNEDGMDLEVEWDRDPGKGFGWFSPYWTGDDPGPGAAGKRNVIVDGLTSIGLVNNPNIREFRLANEAGENLTQRRGGAEFKMPQHLIDLAKRFDDRKSLANVTDKNGIDHDEAGSPEGGQFAPKAGEWDAKGRKLFDDNVKKYAAWKKLDHRDRQDLARIVNDLLKNGRDKYSLSSRYLRKSKNEAKRGEEMHSFYSPKTFSDEKRELRTSLKELHRYAILKGLKYNNSTHQYE